VAVKSQKKLGAPMTVDLDALLAQPAGQRKKWFEANADRTLTDRVASAVKVAAAVQDLHAALAPVIEVHATPDLVPPGAMVLQPSEERRRSGSHYTPRSLTEPIVRTTLEPILERLHGEEGEPPAPEQILDLKVCDPAMGSGAFLVETCRQLGDALIEAWSAHGGRPEMPPDEDEVVFARRMVAQRCLYGVDRNPVAVDLAKVSLWLVTLARDHALTFVDHALRHGDSLVGLTNAQIADFRWDEKAPAFEAVHVGGRLQKALELRDRIRTANDAVTDDELREWWKLAEDELDEVRLYADLVVAAFFSAQTTKDRENQRVVFADAIHKGTAQQYRTWLEAWRHDEKPLVPFHWELEFPEVFGAASSAFDALVGNPPFAGVTTLCRANLPCYTDWLRQSWPDTGGKCDLVAFFFRRVFDLLHGDGCMGLLATNSIANGDTRESGLAAFCDAGAVIYAATKRIAWPGSAAVIVSAVHVAKHLRPRPVLDGRQVSRISAFLLEGSTDHVPPPIPPAIPSVTKGVVPYGEGFVVGAEPSNIPEERIREVLEREPGAAVFVRPYLRGRRLNSSPTTQPDAHIVDFSGRELDDLQEVPLLLGLLEEHVRPQREALTDQSGAKALKEKWWRYQYEAADLFREIRESKLTRVIVTARVSPTLGFAFVSPNQVFNEKVIVFPEERAAAFSMLQSGVHDSWVRFLTGARKDDINYSPSDCFETFPFSEGWENDPALEAAGEAYYTFRADLMVRNDEGLTKTYNRFHDPEESDLDIVRLRELHADMDRAVLDAYGWSDIPTDCEFLLDYEIDEAEWGRKKKPYRYRWPDDVRDEVLARLLELNARRAEEEKRAGVGAAKKGKKAVRVSEDQERLI